MGKSLDNYIGVSESPREMFGKTMSIPDDMLVKYFELATDVSLEEIKKIESAIKEGEKPRNLKVKLAKEIVALYHSSDDAENAEKEFAEIFKNKGLPDKIELVKLSGPKWNIVDLIAECKLTQSKSEGRRIVQGGGVKLIHTKDLKSIDSSEKIESHEEEIDISEEKCTQVGKRKFIRVVSK